MKKPLAYVNLTTMDIAIGFYLDKIPDEYQPVYPEEYVNALESELKATKSRLQAMVLAKPMCRWY